MSQQDEVEGINTIIPSSELFRGSYSTSLLHQLAHHRFQNSANSASLSPPRRDPARQIVEVGPQNDSGVGVAPGPDAPSEPCRLFLRIGSKTEDASGSIP